jgi:predicted DNA-binding transcriptional regulator YafY
MAKADNLLAVLWLLKSHRRLTAAQIAESLEMSIRTVYRYIDALCASGVPVIADTGADGGYRLPDSFRSTPLFFEATELVALFQAAQFARQAGHPYTGALETALTKVQRNLAPEQAAELEKHAAAITVTGWERPPRPVAPWLPALEQAVADSVTVELAYRKPEDENATRRLVDPYGLMFRAGLWYVVGHCHLRGGVRDFRVDRIEGLTRTEARFRRPEGFALESRYGDDWIKQRRQTGDLIPVRISGKPGAVAALCDHWYLRHFVVEQAPREALLHIDPIGRQHTAPTLLPYGTAIRVTEPADLREELRRLALTWAQHHAED